MHEKLKPIPYQDRDAYLGVDSPEPNHLCPLIDEIKNVMAEIDCGMIDACLGFESIDSLLEELRTKASEFRDWNLALRNRIADLCLTKDRKHDNIAVTETEQQELK